MKTYLGINENINYELMRIAGMVHQFGWPEGSQGAVIGLQGPTFCWHNCENRAGYYTKAFVQGFMVWQEENFA